MIYNRLNDYFMHNNILTKEQFGFRIKNSINQVIADVVNKPQNSFENRLSTCLILLDLLKALDTMDRIKENGPSNSANQIIKIWN